MQRKRLCIEFWGFLRDWRRWRGWQILGIVERLQKMKRLTNFRGKFLCEIFLGEERDNKWPVLLP